MGPFISIYLRDSRLVKYFSLARSVVTHPGKRSQNRWWLALHDGFSVRHFFVNVPVEKIAREMGRTP